MSATEKKTINFKTFLLVLIVGIPLWMWLAWIITPNRNMQVALIDKTVLTPKGQEHISLNWVLTNERFTKSNGDLYKSERDYFGFFPLADEKYELKGLERFDDNQLHQMASSADLVYITDTYGIYSNEWFKIEDPKERSTIIYGGMSKQDILFIDEMRRNHKLIISEFNSIASPTSIPVRREFEDSFGIHWLGWVGRYFDSFDTTVNPELPKWLIRNFERQYNVKWPFKKSGIAYVHSDDRVVILENETDLLEEIPSIYSSDEGQKYYGMPEKIKYSYWFDIIQPDTSFNHVISYFKVAVNEKGRAQLKNFGIPESFPAVTAHINSDYRMFYFSADFCDNPISLFNSHFKGISYFRWLFYNTHDPVERRSFFWTLYRPLVSRILNDYYKTLPNK